MSKDRANWELTVDPKGGKLCPPKKGNDLVRIHTPAKYVKYTAEAMMGAFEENERKDKPAPWIWFELEGKLTKLEE